VAGADEDAYVASQAQEDETPLQAVSEAATPASVPEPTEGAASDTAASIGSCR
jgi:hypothetical protein